MPGDVQVHGDSGPLVLLLSGGAESCNGFFPGLVEGLVEEPGCRVVVHDRPGTGTSDEEGSLADAASHLAGLVQRLDRGPAIVVGQSLGGAVALLLAMSHPEAVAGLALIDPTPINDAPLCARLEQGMVFMRRLARVPGVSGVLRAAVVAGVRWSMRGKSLRPDCEAVLEKIAHHDIVKLADAVRGISTLSAEFRAAQLPTIPALLVTADRKPSDPIARSHSELATALGTPLVTWPGASHCAHL
ncbi:MAG: alpha/beta hydrolase, partial [Cystobacter sp.]